MLIRLFARACRFGALNRVGEIPKSSVALCGSLNDRGYIYIFFLVSCRCCMSRLGVCHVQTISSHSVNI